MHRTPPPSVQVAAAAPLLRLVLILVLLLAAVAGMLVASSAHLGWLTLALAVVAGPVAVVVEGRSRAERAPRPEASPTEASSIVHTSPDLGLA